jgi:hypothetical protein
MCAIEAKPRLALIANEALTANHAAAPRTSIAIGLPLSIAATMRSRSFPR